jgi:uncharacterized protein with von Willebrand factor type A (vWA) domain
MHGMKSQNLHLSTIRYIEDIPEGQYVGIVTFDHRSKIRHKCVQITNRSVKDSLIGKVPKKARGGTDIGGGLLKGLKALNQQRLSTEGATFILVTDGNDETYGSGYLDRVLPQLLSAKV